MNLKILKSDVGDNFFFLIADEDGRAALFDPIDAEQAVEWVQRERLELVYVINTHFHPDHVGGNTGVIDAFPEAKVVAGAVDAETIDGQFGAGKSGSVDETVVGGDTIEVGDLSLDVIETPGHTPGHISLLHGHHLFSGDTIFVGGAGNCRFGGDPGALYKTFRDVLRKLPPETVFYPGHDYAVRNAEFLLSIEPEHPETQSVLEEAKRAGEAGQLMKTTLGRERVYNAFMRYDDESLQEALTTRYAEELEQARSESEGEGEAVFRCLRKLRDNW